MMNGGEGVLKKYTTHGGGLIFCQPGHQMILITYKKINCLLPAALVRRVPLTAFVSGSESCLCSYKDRKRG